MLQQFEGRRVVHGMQSLPQLLHRDFDDRVLEGVHGGDTVCLWVNGALERCVGGQWLDRLQLCSLFAETLPSGDYLHKICLSEDGTWLVAWSSGGTSGTTLLVLLEVATGQVHHRWSVRSPGIYVSVWISERHQALVVFRSEDLLWWELDRLTSEPATITPTVDSGEDIWPHPDGRTLITSSGRNGLLAHDLVTRRSWSLVPDLGDAELVGFADAGRTLLVIETNTTSIRRLDLETGQWGDTVTLDQPPQYLNDVDACFSPDGAWLVGTESGKTGLWSTTSGQRIAQWAAPPLEEEDDVPNHSASANALLSIGMSVDRFALPESQTDAVRPTCLVSQQMATPDSTLRLTLAPEVIAQISRLGGRIDGDSLEDFLDARWPEGVSYHGEVGDNSVWMVRLRSMGTLPEEWDVGRFMRLHAIAEMDGGNYLLAIRTNGRMSRPVDPLVYQFDHDQLDRMDIGYSVGSLSRFLAALRPEAPR